MCVSGDMGLNNAHYKFTLQIYRAIVVICLLYYY